MLIDTIPFRFSNDDHHDVLVPVAIRIDQAYPLRTRWSSIFWGERMEIP